MWKKSGAWFFKSLPKYILPGQKSNANARGRGSRASRKGRFSDDSSSDEEKKFWTMRERRSSGTESTYGKSMVSVINYVNIFFLFFFYIM